ncbi:uncharacterized protein LOC115451918 [Manduca sexta]|uniref:uncharacterized protein LOC115451918 n=1 Tax=Manduca sexta TaxID=7130 RepID=UPI00188ED4F5|nr:uncharacterized protein LOC115451918 [Manduca sexta]
MLTVFYLITIFIFCRGFTEDPNYTIGDETTQVTENIGDFNQTVESTTYATGESTISKSSRSTRHSTTKRRRTPRTTYHTPRTTLFQRYHFESVDYNDLPTDLKTYHTDCYAQYIRCVRHRTDHNPVCGYNTHSGYYDDYYSACEIELQNCLYRMQKGLGLFGTNYTNDIIFYNGEGYNCIYYLRRAKNEEEMHKLYFGVYDNDDPDYNN